MAKTPIDAINEFYEFSIIAESDKSVFIELSKIDKLWDSNPIYAININGTLVNIGRYRKSNAILKKAASRLEYASQTLMYNKQKILYDTGNCYQSLAYNSNKSIHDNSYYNKARFYFEKVNHENNDSDSYIRAKLDSALILEHQNRDLEAIRLYDKILNLYPSLGIALGQKAYCLKKYNDFLERPSFLTIKKAEALYKQALADNSLEKYCGSEIRLFFARNLVEIQEKYENEISKNFTTKTPRLNQYFQYCLQHDLYLNDDMGVYYNKHSIMDTIFPQLQQEKTFSEEMPPHVSWGFITFNEIIEAYSSSRLMFFNISTKKYSSFDKKVNFTQCQIGTKNSHRFGILKMVFTNLYNCLDKICHMAFYYFLRTEKNVTQGISTIYFSDFNHPDMKEFSVKTENFFY